MQHALSLKPYQSKYRVALFLRFQEANDNAANALLKTLEEAPAHAILLLTARLPDPALGGVQHWASGIASWFEVAGVVVDTLRAANGAHV